MSTTKKEDGRPRYLALIPINVGGTQFDAGDELTGENVTDGHIQSMLQQHQCCTEDEWKELEKQAAAEEEAAQKRRVAAMKTATPTKS